MTSKRILLAAARAEITRREHLCGLILKLDPRIAARALEVFASPTYAVEWLMFFGFPAFPEGTTLAATQTPYGRKRVLRLLDQFIASQGRRRRS